jgi:excisionase family DNA binding protein
MTEPIPDSRQRFLSVEEAAKILAISSATVREYARKGIVPARKIGKHWRFLEADLMQAGEPNVVRRAAVSVLRRSSPIGNSRVAQIVRNARRRMSTP